MKKNSKGLNVFLWISCICTVFLTQVISHRQKNADAKAVQLILHQQKWNSRRQFLKNFIFPNIQLKGVGNTLPPFKNLLIGSIILSKKTLSIT